jgi:hypothetical protein
VTKSVTVQVAPTPPVISVSSVLTVDAATNVVLATFTLTNTGGSKATGIVVTQSTLAGIFGSPLPQNVKNLAPGASATFNVLFPPSVCTVNNPFPSLFIEGTYHWNGMLGFVNSIFVTIP